MNGANDPQYPFGLARSASKACESLQDGAIFYLVEAATADVFIGGRTEMKVARKQLPCGQSLFVEFCEALERRLMFTSALPELPAVQAPTSNPALPTGFDTFVPPTTLATPSAGTPQIAGATNSANPGDTISISDVNISSLPASDKDSDTEFVTYGQTTSSNGALVQDTIQQLSPNISSVTLASDNTPNSMYFLWAENANGFSAPVAINKTDAMWIGPNQATAGQTISVYGQNLTFTATDGKSWVYITQAGSSSGQWASVVSANPYCVTFVVPENLSAGNYQVWAHNGHGGVYGWSSPVTLTVTAPAAASTQIFNVASFGAIGNGVTDDTAAFNAAIGAASKYPGAEVYVPAGTYVISQITIGDVQLVGAGQGTTTLLGAPVSSPSYAMLWVDSDTQVKDITLNTNNVAYSYLMWGRADSNLHFTDVTFNANLTGYFDIHGDNLVFFDDCNMIGNGSFLGTASQVFFDGCNFYGTNDANTLLYSWGGTGISVTNCTAQDLNNSNPNSGAGWAKGRFFVASPIWGTESDIYIADNTTIDLGVRPTYPDQNVGEQISFEGNELYTFAGSAFAGATANSVTITGLPSSFTGVGYDVVIAGGDGVGEYLPVSAYDANIGVITLAGAWNVLPDSTSIVRLGTIQDGIVVYANHLSGKGAFTTTASAGVEFWGGAMNVVVDSNTISNVRTAICSASIDFEGNTEPSYWNIFENNSITNAIYGFTIGNDGTGGEVGALGVIARDNQITGAIAGAFLVYNNYDAKRNDFFATIEDNTASNIPVALLITIENYAPTDTAGMANILLDGNTFDLGTASPSGAYGIDADEITSVVSQSNDFENYPQLDGGTSAFTFAQPFSAAPADNVLSEPAVAPTAPPTSSGSDSSEAQGTSSNTNAGASNPATTTTTKSPSSTSVVRQARSTPSIKWVASPPNNSVAAGADDLKKLHLATAILSRKTSVLAA